MEVLTEIYLTTNYVTDEKWLKLIEIISKYNGYFKSWILVLNCSQNKVRYFLKTKCVLPPTINGLNDFLLKQESEIQVPENKGYIPFIYMGENNFSDIYGYYESKKIYLEWVKIKIIPLLNNRFLSSTKLYFRIQNRWICRRYYFNIPTHFISINFDINKRFIFKRASKYLKLDKQFSLLNSSSKNSILQIDTFPYLQGDYFLDQNTYQFDKHSLILGSSGSGKSKFISLLIHNICKNPSQKLNYKVILIDPHAALEEDIGGLEDTKVLDFNEKEDTINLFSPSGTDFISSTELFLSLFKNLMIDQYNSKLERVLRYAIHFLLVSNQFDFSNLRKLILDVEYRTSLLKVHKQDLPFSVLEFFLNDFNELKTNFYGEAISPIISFIDEMQLLPVFNKNEKYQNLKDVMRDHFLTIFSLDRIKLGDKITKTISGLVMQQLLSLVQSNRYNEKILFVLDEISVIENPIVCRFLSEARKYNVSVLIAGQYLNQVSKEVRDAIFANVVNYYIFRVSKLDATILVDNFDINIPLDNTKEYKIKMLSELPNRTCIVRVSNVSVLYSSMKGKTLDFVSSPRRKKESKQISHSNNSLLKKKFEFKTDSSLNLNDIFKSTSTGRKKGLK